MSADRAALIAGILAAPDDDAPRLICADWFQERGDEASVARAEFIRTQIERANLSPTDPRQSELCARELRLLKAHGAAWTGAHFAFKKCRFRRGFIEYVHLHLQHFLHHRRQLLALEPVRDVSLTGWMRAEEDLVARVAACEEWKHIDTLRIHHQGPHKDPRSPLVTLIESPHLTGLRSLRLPRIAITADARRRFERAPVLRSLRELTLPYLVSYHSHNPDGWFVDGGSQGAWEGLRVLRIRDYPIRADVLSNLTAMPCWNQLTELDVRLGWSRPAEIEALRDRLPGSLRTLRLNGGASESVDTLCARIVQLPLTGLHIHGIRIEPGVLGQILSESSRCALRELTLSECELNDDHLRVVAGAPSVRDVWALDLSANWETSESGARELFTSEHMRSVARLRLNGVPIGQSGVEALADAGWDGLRSLDMSGAGVPTRTLHQLLGSPTFSNVVSFRYTGPHDAPGEFSVELARHLASLPHLASVRLEDTPINSEARDVLLSSESLAWAALDRADRENWGNYDPNVLAPLDDELTHANQRS